MTATSTAKRGLMRARDNRKHRKRDQLRIELTNHPKLSAALVASARKNVRDKQDEAIAIMKAALGIGDDE